MREKRSEMMSKLLYPPVLEPEHRVTNRVVHRVNVPHEARRPPAPAEADTGVRALSDSVVGQDRVGNVPPENRVRRAVSERSEPQTAPGHRRAWYGAHSMSANAASLPAAWDQGRPDGQFESATTRANGQAEQTR